MTKTAFILIDIQNDYFPDGKWEVHEMTAAAQNASHILKVARSKGVFVVHVRHEIPAENPPFFAKGSTGAQINSLVAPQGLEPVITKNFPNSFRDTNLKEILDAENIENVTICGAMSQMCIDGTARAAADYGYKTTVISDACAAKEQVFEGTVVPAPMVHATIMASLGTYAAILKTDSYLNG
jgi:nicotinamidase-related amidase